ncbi:hypothetical protein DdX_14778 [Ditylenchus destructor]|uniref:Uncharacterized protein n=1 Tax=Ditylenchus destructor TaxID=166010 RepID=A0AAD4MTE9_9BILA|nr:hypothetical protein DdX_14778 [Ditylenchus destructor]
MYSKVFFLTVIVLVTQVAARPPSSKDECVLGDNSTCPLSCVGYACVQYVCVRMNGCGYGCKGDDCKGQPPRPCKPPTKCERYSSISTSTMSAIIATLCQVVALFVFLTPVVVTAPAPQVSPADFKTEAEKVANQVIEKKSEDWIATLGSKFRALVESKVVPAVVQACNGELKREFDAMNKSIAAQGEASRKDLEAEFEKKKNGLIIYYRTQVVREKIQAVDKETELEALKRALDPKYTAGWTGH